MKRKILFTLCLLGIVTSAVTAFANKVEEAAKRFDTEPCTTITWSGTTMAGARCAVPDNDGPCTRATICR